MLNDLRHAWRALVSRPGFFAVCVLTISLGVGATAAIFSAVNGVLLRPLPYPDDNRLVMLWYANERESIERDVTSFPTFSDWQRAESVRSAGAYTDAIGTFTGDRDAEQFSGAWVVGDFFATLGVRAALGTGLDERHAQAGSDQVVVLSHRAREAWFGDGADVVGRRLDVDGTSREIVGVMPQGFSYPSGADFWLPIAPDSDSWSQLTQSRGAYWLSVVARLADGATIETAAIEFDALAARMITDGDAQPGDGVFVEPLRDTIVGSVRPAITALAGAVAFVLLIACANLANLLLARGASRQREFAVRAALGANGRVLARQALTESVLLALIGAVVGLALAYAGTAALGAAGPVELPRLDDIRVDLGVVGFGLLVAIVTGFLFGAAPALQARSAGLAPALREGDRGASGGALARLRPALVVVEIALALVLLIGAGLLIRSFASLQSVDPGFRTQDVLTFRTTLPSSRYPEVDQVRAFTAAFEERLAALPGVTGVAAVNTLFLQRLPNMGPVNVEGRPAPAPDDPVISVTNDFVSAGFFAEMALPLVAGRGFTAADGADAAPVVVVNETFVRRHFPDEDPIGKRFTRNNPSPDAVWQTIVGVAADSRRAGLGAEARPEAYRPLTQATPRTLEWLVHTALPPLSVVPQVRALARELDPNLALAGLTTVDAKLADSVATQRFVMTLLSAFAALALVLATVGLYGVLAYLVAQRRREIGVRIAIGAARAAVVRMVLRQSLRYIVPGIVLGLIASLALTQGLRSQLHGVSAADPLTFVTLAALLGVVALAASWWPAHRASRVDPISALREE